VLGFSPLASGPLGVSGSGDITLSATESLSTQVLITVSLGTINTNIGYPTDTLLSGSVLVTSATSNVTALSTSSVELTSVDVGIVEINSDAYLATQDNSVTLAGFSMSVALVSPISTIVGVFRTIPSYSIQSAIGDLDLTGYNFLLDFPALPLLTSSLGEPRFAVVYNSALQSDAPYNHDQEVTVSLGTITTAIANQGATSTLSLISTVGNIQSNTGVTLQSLEQIVELAPLDNLVGVTDALVSLEVGTVILEGLDNRVGVTDPVGSFDIGTLSVEQLANDSQQTQLDNSLFIGTVVYNTTFEHPFQVHPNLVAEDSLLATVSLEQLANHSDQIELTGVSGTISLDPLANEVAVKELGGLPIPLTLSDITINSQNNIPVTNPDFATVSLGIIRLNVTQEVVGSGIGSVSLGDISTQTVSNIILTTSEVALESNLDITHTLSARVTHNSNVIPISIGDISLVTHANTTLGGFEVVSAHGILSPFALSGLFLTLHDNVQGVTATGVHFDYEAIKHLYNPARSSFPLPVSRQVRPTLAVSNKATVTPTSPRKIAA
tara:strand:- start:736 stop:2391 length:1656 start_codon:yes stop_codon:yes gene_type:complete